MKRPAAALAALAAAGCGAPPGDLFAVERSGSIPGASLRLVVSDGGKASCNRRAGRALPPQMLLDARDLERRLAALAPRTLAPGRGGVYSYTVRLEQGTITFDDNSPGAAGALLELQALTRAIAREVCGLER